MDIKIGVCNDLENKNNRYAILEFKMMAFVTDNEDTCQRLDGAANDGESEEDGSGDAPSMSFGPELVANVSYQCDDIDSSEIIHRSNGGYFLG